MDRCDILLRGGLVVDGTGAPGRRADVAITAGRITAVGEVAASAGEVVDATGRTITPGFIDVHTHADAVPWLPVQHDDLRFVNLRQGVTTEVTGNCALSLFPTVPERHDAAAAGLAAIAPTPMPAFSDLDAYRSAAESAGMATNIAPLVGHSAVRFAVAGADARPLTDREVAHGADLIAAAMDAGAFGWSTGLIYPPGAAADVAEMAAFSRPVAEAGGVYATHMRDEGDGVVESMHEAFATARASGVKLNISHHHINGRRNWGRSSETLRLLDEVRRAGLDVTIDAFPYDSGGTGLGAILPPWAADGGKEAAVARLRDPAHRSRVVRALVEGAPGWQNLGELLGWDCVRVSQLTTRPEWNGLSVAAMAERAGATPEETVLDLWIAEPGNPMVMLDSQSIDDVRAIVAATDTMIGADGIPFPGSPHPRGAAAFARVLRWSREGLLPFEETVRRMTSLPADRFRIPERGRVEVGAVADLVVLHPSSVAEGADEEDPNRPPTGVDHVLVAGGFAVRAGRPTDLRGGRMLRPGSA